jgi:AmmeMemoRadiSam system protein A
MKRSRVVKVTESHEHKVQLSDKEILLKIARNSILSLFSKGTDEGKTDYTGFLSDKLGAFVSIHTKNGALRGCLGQIISETPLYRLVKNLAKSAASHDYRFNPLKKDELEDIVIEVSVLSPLKRIYSLTEIERGIHGIYIKDGKRSGTFLPQVIQETGWDIETFVSKCSKDKAGLGPDGWKDAEMYVYTAEVFKESPSFVRRRS